MQRRTVEEVVEKGGGRKGTEEGQGRRSRLMQHFSHAISLSHCCSVVVTSHT